MFSEQGQGKNKQMFVVNESIDSHTSFNVPYFAGVRCLYYQNCNRSHYWKVTS